MKSAALQCLLLLATLLSTEAFVHFQAEIPNGDFVPHPCKPNFVWKGVGHINQAGGGRRNQFGKDFHEAGKTWTQDLCRKDSDGDGKTNGEELGDPNCTWTKGNVPEIVGTGISHPGICDPWGSAQCGSKNDWVSCKSDEFVCPAIKEEGVITKELRFPYTNVPSKETSYMCVGFDLPSDDDYHLIATTPIINETRVMHHIVLIGCTEEAEHINEPTECLMGLQGCTTTIGLWTLGLPGECLYKEAGIRFGNKGLKRAVLQFHWTNPELRTDLWDSSGITLYYTKKLRKYDAGSFSTGQTYLEIPPLSPKVVQQSQCSGYCTKKMMNESIYLTTGLNHMHYLDVCLFLKAQTLLSLSKKAIASPKLNFTTIRIYNFEGSTEYVKLIREDGSELMLTDDKYYSYDTPVLYIYDPPIEVKPGDSFETVCTYKSLSRKVTARFGEGTFDEMCFGIFNFYPTYVMRTPYPTCITKKDFQYCDLNEWKCDFRQIGNFSNEATRALIDKVMDHCTYLGECLHGCRDVVDDIMNNHNCFKNGRAENVIYPMLLAKNDNYTVEAFKFVTAMQSCKYKKENPIVYIINEDSGKPVDDGSSGPTDDGNSANHSNVFSWIFLVQSCLLYIIYYAR